MAAEDRNIDDICARLKEGTLASELAVACRDNSDATERANAIGSVLQRRLDTLLTGGVDAKIPRA